MIIYVCCAGGTTSSMFCQRLTEAAKESPLRVTMTDINSVVAQADSLSREFDLMFAYGPIDAISVQSAKQLATVFDGVLVCPQVAYLLEHKQALVAEYGLSIKPLAAQIFGHMNGKLALDELLVDLVALDFQRGSYQPSNKNQGLNHKNLTLFFTGGDPKMSFFKAFIAALGERNLRVLTEAYTKNTYYTLHEPKENYDLRFLFSQPEEVKLSRLKDFAEQVDLVIVDPINRVAFREKAKLLAKLNVEVVDIDMISYGRNDGRGALEKMADALFSASLKSEYQEEKDYYDVIKKL